MVKANTSWHQKLTLRNSVSRPQIGSTPSTLHCLSDFLLYNKQQKKNWVLLIIQQCFKKAVGQKEGVFIPVLWKHSWNEPRQHRDEIQKQNALARKAQPMWDCERGWGKTTTPPAWLDLGLAAIHRLPAHTGMKPELKPVTASAVPCGLSFKTCKAAWEDRPC